MNRATCLKYLRKVAICAPLSFVGHPAVANDFTAEKVLKEMNAGEKFSYVAGVIEGLAMARYVKDGKKPEGMNCIYGWFYDDKKTVDTIYAAFEKYSTYPPGTIIDVLVKRKCGE